MKTLLALWMITILIGCGEKKQVLPFFKVDKKHFDKYINDKPLPNDPNLTVDKSIINYEYPIEISLYKDNKWFYNLPRLGEGEGTYAMEDGKLILTAQRKLFIMRIEIRASDEQAKNVHITFRDRFGDNTYKMTKNNLD